MSPDSGYQHLRVPPQHLESEEAVLGALMISPAALDDIADLLTAEDFYLRLHQIIYRSILELRESGKPWDAVTIGEWFEANGLGAQVAGGSYLVDLAMTTPSAANARAYAEIVADKSSLRKLVDVGTAAVAEAFEPNGRKAEEIISSNAAKMANLTLRTSGTGGLRMFNHALQGAWQHIVDRDAGTIEIGLTPPWKNVAKILPGLEDTDFMVIAGRPGMGKTVCGLEFAHHAACQGRNVAFFSLEMSEEQLALRLVARQARVDQSLMRIQGGLSPSDWTAINEAYKQLKNLPLAIDHEANLTIDALTARAARMHSKIPGGMGLVVVDYIQLMSGDGKREDKRHDEITKISRGLKLLAKKLKCPVIALSQLNRSLEGRTEKRPTMADLRESGAIEQDADVIAFVYRDDYYTKDASAAPGIGEFIIAKQRQGVTGTAYLRHHLESSFFSDYYGPAPRYDLKRAGKKAASGFDTDDEPSGRDRAAGLDS